ncbi:uncharacterized protein LOC117105930 [Anneissia japonica]|uniref:uncharacterized protein LOC117105930 n=1 Tax=Anneissia japonica TaxID=1529436 RepID=UPI0014257C11|nr:uncharacterized protein LOC117105930 [Anneissia japonica]
MSLTGSHWLTIPSSKWNAHTAHETRSVTAEIAHNEKQLKVYKKEVSEDNEAAENEQLQITTLEKEQTSLVEKHERKIQLFEELEAEVAHVTEKLILFEDDLMKQKKFIERLKKVGKEKMKEVDDLKTQIVDYKAKCSEELHSKKTHKEKIINSLKSLDIPVDDLDTPSCPMF